MTKRPVFPCLRFLPPWPPECPGLFESGGFDPFLPPIGMHVRPAPLFLPDFAWTEGTAGDGPNGDFLQGMSMSTMAGLPALGIRLAARSDSGRVSAAADGFGQYGPAGEMPECLRPVRSRADHLRPAANRGEEPGHRLTALPGPEVPGLAGTLGGFPAEWCATDHAAGLPWHGRRRLPAHPEKAEDCVRIAKASGTWLLEAENALLDAMNPLAESAHHVIGIGPEGEFRIEDLRHMDRDELADRIDEAGPNPGASLARDGPVPIPMPRDAGEIPAFVHPVRRTGKNRDGAVPVHVVADGPWPVPEGRLRHCVGGGPPTDAPASLRPRLPKSLRGWRIGRGPPEARRTPSLPDDLRKSPYVRIRTVSTIHIGKHPNDNVDGGSAMSSILTPMRSISVRRIVKASRYVLEETGGLYPYFFMFLQVSPKPPWTRFSAWHR